jgi:hypothetical protein
MSYAVDELTVGERRPSGPFTGDSPGYMTI